MSILWSFGKRYARAKCAALSDMLRVRLRRWAIAGAAPFERNGGLDQAVLLPVPLFVDALVPTKTVRLNLPTHTARFSLNLPRLAWNCLWEFGAIEFDCASRL